MRLMKTIFLFLCALFFLASCGSDQALAPGDDPIQKEGTNCEEVVQAGVPTWKYCMHRYAKSSKDVLIYFHGLGADETDWSNGDLTQKMLATWREKNIPIPLVISISFGPTWFLAEKNSSTYSGLYETFLLSGFMLYLLSHRFRRSGLKI